MEKRPGHGDGVDEARSTTFKAIIHSRPQSLSILVTWSWNEGLVGYKLSWVALGTRMAIIISHSWQNQADWFFLGRDFAHMVRTTWKRSKPCIFVLEQSRQIQTLQLKQQKKMWILSFFIAKLPEKAKKIEILLRFQRWMTKTNILRARSILSWTSGNFWCRNWNRNRRKPGGQRRFYQPTEKCKHRRLLIWTLALLRYIEVNGMKTGKTESLPASELDHFLS